jgi:hypothetical protein
VIVYEQFGFKVDRRGSCPAVPGGAWIVDPASGQVTRQLVPELHLSALVTDQEGTRLYGLSPGGGDWDHPQLVEIDPVSGRVVRSRYLDAGFWRLAVAPLRIVPSGDVHVK